ncbi:hypothetical protein CYY_000937 [Polysphondylium violaceum]|uniref:Uncharacterized protein n=1 Tax=Polysphondylium violaceum TaxID=133409 RepID=A0A8J4Q1W7_9MYCE|nr:hypothetical protein CYY_000937 [Polysphondylium violaceum]
MSVYQKSVSHAPATLARNDTVAEDDDWETDPDYANDISEKDQRWGSKETQKQELGNMDELRNKVVAQDDRAVKEEYEKKKMLYGGERAALSKRD